MKKTCIGKILVIGLIILFAGASGISSIGAKNISYSKLMTTNNTLVEPLFEGNSYFILLSDYTDGAGQDNKWAVQMRFDSALMVVEAEYDAIQLPLILDRWVEIRVEINLDGDWHEVYYDGEFFYDKEWTAGPNNLMDGILNIGAVDLYANGASPVYYDDLSLEEVGGSVVWSDNFDSYTNGQFLDGTPDDGGWKGWDNDPLYGASVTNAESRSSPHSVNVNGDTDLVHEYSGYTSGEYIYTAWVYIPEDIGDPPGAPDIDGQTKGTAGVEYDYVFNAVDPDNDDVKYHITWGDPHSDVTDLYPSGTDVTVSHTYEAEGTFTITAYAEDAKGLIGPENTLTVTMPRSRAVPTFLERIFERFPYAFPILRQLFGL